MTNNNKLLAWVSIAMLVVSLSLIVLTVFGYGSLRLDVPKGSTVSINGHTVSAGDTSIKLRPGTYHISTSSARYYSTYDTVHVSPFRTTNFASDRQERTPESIAYSADGVSAGDLPPPPVSSIQWVEDTWVVEEVGFSTPSVLVAHYEHGRWNEAYKTGDTIDAAKLPTAVVRLINQKEEATRASLH